MLSRPLAALAAVALLSLAACSGEDEGGSATDTNSDSPAAASGVTCDYPASGQASSTLAPKMSGCRPPAKAE